MPKSRHKSGFASFITPSRQFSSSSPGAITCAGEVSPVTAGGIHTALKHGLAAGHAVAEFLEGKCEDPSRWFAATYPKFRTKRLLRFLFDRFQNDWIFNLTLASRPMRMAASQVYFHRRGVMKSRASTTKSPPSNFEA